MVASTARSADPAPRVGVIALQPSAYGEEVQPYLEGEDKKYSSNIFL